MDTRKLENWEHIAFNTYRLRVEGGWLYRYTGPSSMAMAFVPITPTTHGLDRPRWREY